MSFEAETFTTRDNTEIAGRLFLPAAAPKGAVAIAAAMGVGQDFYAPLAAWLSRKGFLAATFDYRGTGLSLKGRLRGYKASIFDWIQDCSTILDELSKRTAGKPVFWIGHSLGGQIAPFVERINDVSKIITVACGSGYWLENAWPLRSRVWWLWYFVVPLTLPFFGYFPGRRLGMVGDLPKDVMAQWRRWCLNRHYCIGAEGPIASERYAAIRVPVLALAFEDDEMMSKKNIESLHGFLSNAPVTVKRIAPGDVGRQRIGHFGFFKEKFEGALWETHLLAELNG